MRVFVFWSFSRGGRGWSIFMGLWELKRLPQFGDTFIMMLKNVASRAKTHISKPILFFFPLTCILRVILTYFERFNDTQSRNKSNNAYTHISMLEYVSIFVSEPSRKMGRNKSKFFVVNGIFLPTFLSLVCCKLNPASSSILQVVAIDLSKLIKVQFSCTLHEW